MSTSPTAALSRTGRKGSSSKYENSIPSRSATATSRLLSLSSPAPLISPQVETQTPAGLISFIAALTRKYLGANLMPLTRRKRPTAVQAESRTGQDSSARQDRRLRQSEGRCGSTAEGTTRLPKSPATSYHITSHHIISHQPYHIITSYHSVNENRKTTRRQHEK